LTVTQGKGSWWIQLTASIFMFYDTHVIVLACDLQPTNHDSAHNTLRIGEQIRGCESAVLRICNMITFVHPVLTHTYANAQQLSGMPMGYASLMFSVIQFCLNLLNKGGVLNSPKKLQLWQIAKPSQVNWGTLGKQDSGGVWEHQGTWGAGGGCCRFVRGLQTYHAQKLNQKRSVQTHSLVLMCCTYIFTS